MKKGVKLILIKAVFKHNEKDVQYGKILHDRVTLLPCFVTNNKILDGTIVNLTKITKSGKLEVIKNKVGKVIKANDNSVKIKFNITFGYDDKLYALMITPYNIKVPGMLTVAYKEA